MGLTEKGVVMKKLLLGGLIVWAGMTASAAIIAGYDFDDGTGTGTLAPTLASSRVSATNFGVGSGTGIPPFDGLNLLINGPNGNSNLSNLDAEGNVFGTANGLEFGGARNAFGFSDLNNANNLNAAINRDEFMTFTVTPDATFVMSLTSFTFRTRVNRLDNSAERWALFSSIAGFTSGDQIIAGRTTVTGTYGTPGSGDVNNVVIDLTAPAFQGLAAATEFRLYIYGGDANTSSATLFDKVILNGSVVPEPSTYAAFAVLLVGCGFFIRRRREKVA